jgi:hypothetical protein
MTTTINLIEYSVISKVKDNAFNTQLSEETINMLLNQLQFKSLKAYERMIKTYVHGNVFYEIIYVSEDDKPDIKAYTKNIQDVSTTEHKNIIKVSSIKQKIPIHAFPSSNDLDQITYIKRLILRKTNRIFVNIEYHHDVDKTAFWKCYVNVNLDSNSDADYLSMEVKPLLEQIQSVLMEPIS